MTARIHKLQLTEVLPGSRADAEADPVTADYGSQTVAVAPAVTPENDYHSALVATLRLYRSATDKGDIDLAARAEQAVAALMGGKGQKHLRHDSRVPEKPSSAEENATVVGLGAELEHTLCGLGPTSKR